jgi:hypothetical protein
MTPNPVDILNPSADPQLSRLPVPKLTGDDEFLPPLSSIAFTHRPKGKVARLPKHIRDEINVMIRDGLSYPAIIANLKQRGQPELLTISEQNLSNWKNGGHQRWLCEQEWREEIQEELQGALALAAADDQTKLEQITLKMATMRLYQFFKHIEPAAFVAVAREKPESFARLFSALPRITRECLRLQQYRDDLAASIADCKSALTRTVCPPASIDPVSAAKPGDK